MLATNTRPPRRFLEAAAGILLLLLSSLLAKETGELFWLCLLPAYTTFLCLRADSHITVAFTAAAVLYVLFFGTAVLSVPLSAGFLSAVLLWPLALFLIARTGVLPRAKEEQEGGYRSPREAGDPQEARESRRFRIMFEHSRDAVIIHSMDEGKIVDVNQAACEISGYSRQELLGRSVFEFDVGDLDYGEVIAEIERRGTARRETRNRYRDGSLHPVEVDLTLLPMEDGEYLLAVVRDLSERRRLERSNEQRRRYLEAVLHSSPNAVVILDGERRVLDWNPGAEELFGYSADEARGRELGSLIIPDEPDRQREGREITEEVRSGQPVCRRETFRCRRDGSRVPVIVAASPLRGTTEETIYIATYTDVSRLKEAERQVQRLLEEKETLLQEVHHRIKNHMHVICSIISLQRQRLSSSEETGILQEVENRITLMQTLYQKLYTQQSFTSVKLPALIDDLTGDLARSYLAGSPIRLETEVEPLEVSARVSMPIGIIVNELVTNSCKYAFSGGGARVTAVLRLGEECRRIN